MTILHLIIGAAILGTFLWALILAEPEPPHYQVVYDEDGCPHVEEVK